ncbi:MAG: hypothetical protein KDK40_03820 [Chlamydiia bacterium]|nr:hypothetical protein [Chlamydiia bacterium]
MIKEQKENTSRLVLFFSTEHVNSHYSSRFVQKRAISPFSISRRREGLNAYSQGGG